MRNFFSLLFFVWFSLLGYCNAQNVDWLVWPIIDNADEIAVSPFSNTLVKFKKNRKYGVKDQNNNVLIPAEHLKLEISLDQEYVFLGDMPKNKELFLMSPLTGDTIKSYDNVRKFSAKHPVYKHHNYGSYNAIKQFTDRYNLLFEKLEEPYYSQYYKIYNKDNELLIDSIDQHVYYLEEGFLVVNREDKWSIVYDKKGKEVFRSTKRVYNPKSNGKGLYLFGHQLLNKKWEVIHDDDSKHITLLPDYNLYFMHHNKKASLHELDHDSMLSEEYSSIEHFNTDWLILQRKKIREIYSLKKKKVILSLEALIQVPGYHNKNADVFGDNVVIAVSTNKERPWRNMKYGAYNYGKGYLSVDTTFHFVKLTKNSIVTLQSGDIINGNKEFIVFDNQGNERFKANAQTVNELYGNTYFITGEGRFNSLVDSTGKILYKPSYDFILESKDKMWINKIDVRGNRTFYLIQDLIHGLIKEYENVMAFDNNDLYKGELFIFSENDKYGLMTLKDGVILEPIFDELKFDKKEKKSKPTNLILAKKNNKWGVFWNPLVENRGY